MARQAGRPVIEVHRSDKVERRRIGKSDPIDAYAAARAVVSGRVRLPAPGRRLMTRQHGRRRARIAFSDSATKQLVHALERALSVLRQGPSRSDSTSSQVFSLDGRRGSVSGDLPADFSVMS
ncbi:hypothetical protein ABID95_001799 [Streptomyces atratus]|uniref:hypothetical protein n=1 Tax=Streptomyces atratus TaxID=1893 RepID=UPI00339613A1